MSRFVRPETRTLTLANGDTLTVRARLTAGETRAQYARMFTHDADGNLKRNPLASGAATITAYLLDWNIRDDSGNVVPIRELSPDDLLSVIDSLDMPSFNEIRKAIDDHETAMALERDGEKKNGWRAAVVSDLIIARRYGWRYEWVRDLPADVYQVLIEEITREDERRE